MIRWFGIFPISETYMDEVINTVPEIFLIKRGMYNNSIKRTAISISVKKQLTVKAFISTNEDELYKKINKKFRNEIRQFKKKLVTDNNYKLIISYKLDKIYNKFLISNYRGQKPNINKLIKLSSSKMLINCILKYQDNFITTLTWVRRDNSCRLIYNVMDHEIMRRMNIGGANKYLMFETIRKFSFIGVKSIDLGGITKDGNAIDRFKKGFGSEITNTYNYIYI